MWFQYSTNSGGSYTYIQILNPSKSPFSNGHYHITFLFTGTDHFKTEHFKMAASLYCFNSQLLRVRHITIRVEYLKTVKSFCNYFSNDCFIKIYFMVYSLVNRSCSWYKNSSYHYRYALGFKCWHVLTKIRFKYKTVQLSVVTWQGRL